MDGDDSADSGLGPLHSNKTQDHGLPTEDTRMLHLEQQGAPETPIPQVKTSFPRTKLQKRSTEMGHPEAAVHLTTPQGKQAVIHALAEKKRWIAEHSNGVLHVCSTFGYGTRKAEECNGDHACNWFCPVCNQYCRWPGILIRHIRTKHREMDHQHVQCWRLYFQTDGCAKYDKSTFDEAPSLASNLPGTPSSNKHVTKKPLSTSAQKKRGRQAILDAIDCSHDSDASDASHNRRESNTGRCAQRQKATTGVRSNAATVTAPAQVIQPANAVPKPVHTVPQPADTLPQPATTADPTATLSQAARTHSPPQGQQQQAAAGQQETQKQLASSDKLEMVRMALSFAEKIAKI